MANVVKHIPTNVSYGSLGFWMDWWLMVFDPWNTPIQIYPSIVKLSSEQKYHLEFCSSIRLEVFLRYYKRLNLELRDNPQLYVVRKTNLSHHSWLVHLEHVNPKGTSLTLDNFASLKREQGLDGSAWIKQLNHAAWIHFHHVGWNHPTVDGRNPANHLGCITPWK